MNPRVLALAPGQKTPVHSNKQVIPTRPVNPLRLLISLVPFFFFSGPLPIFCRLPVVPPGGPYFESCCFRLWLLIFQKTELLPLFRVRRPFGNCNLWLGSTTTPELPRLRCSFVRLPVNFECVQHCRPSLQRASSSLRAASHLALSTSAYLAIVWKCAQLLAGRDTVHTSGPKKLFSRLPSNSFFFPLSWIKKLQCKQEVNKLMIREKNPREFMKLTGLEWKRRGGARGKIFFAHPITFNVAATSLNFLFPGTSPRGVALRC